MEETYTDDVAAWDKARSRELMAIFDQKHRWIVAELMDISFRSGRAIGRRESASAMEMQRLRRVS